jgi:hypothetical protein
MSLSDENLRETLYGVFRHAIQRAKEEDALLSPRQWVHGVVERLKNDESEARSQQEEDDNPDIQE